MTKYITTIISAEISRVRNSLKPPLKGTESDILVNICIISLGTKFDTLCFYYPCTDIGKY